MNKNWISLNIFTNSNKHEIISSYFDHLSLGNHFMNDHFTMYFPLDYKNRVNEIGREISERYIGKIPIIIGVLNGA